MLNKSCHILGVETISVPHTVMRSHITVHSTTRPRDASC